VLGSAREGLDDVPYLTNASLMELRKVPEHLVVLGGAVLGGGYIGLEFGCHPRRRPGAQGR
jgi:pyruvate/2-oxoglutarate dehydrogenase complex dihydrolipoamide dehydrogenase (E3) component